VPDLPAWTAFLFVGLCAGAGTVLLLGPLYCKLRRRHAYGNWYSVSSKIDKRRCKVCGTPDHAYSEYWLRVTQPVEYGTQPLPVATTDTNAIPLLPNGRRASMPAPPRHGRVISHDTPGEWPSIAS
jgi:hypothetical protein